MPLGEHSAKTLADSLGYKVSSSLNRIANKKNDPPFEDFWEYLKVEKNEFDKFQWTKIK